MLLYAVAFSIYALVCFCLFRFTLLVFDNETIALFVSAVCLLSVCVHSYLATLKLIYAGLFCLHVVCL